MSVMIRGVEMPSGCNTCQLHVLCFDYYVCRAKKLERGDYLDVDDEAIAGRRHSCCPLVEIPTPHGRLIDADELETHVDNWWDIGEYVFADTIRNADTIIEAEVSE
ncbi:MAG: hypothetical protein IIY54_06425 [Ruminococcus sp.]|nr:hypothetical protein [Ruminococcus sp.]